MKTPPLPPEDAEMEAWIAKTNQAVRQADEQRRAEARARLRSAFEAAGLPQMDDDFSIGNFMFRARLDPDGIVVGLWWTCPECKVLLCVNEGVPIGQLSQVSVGPPHHICDTLRSWWRWRSRRRPPWLWGRRSQ